MRKMRERIRNKLRGNAGESLGEVLIALLIAALAMTMLASVISSTSKILTKSEEKMKKYDAANEWVTQQKAATDENPLPTDVAVSIIDKAFTVETTTGANSVYLIDSAPANNRVSMFKNGEAPNVPVISYKLKKGEG